MGEVRACDQCAARFTPRREHARFCSARCRVAWNRANRHSDATGGSALAWAVAAMAETTDRLPQLAVLDRPRAFAVICEAVWWVTIVDANLVRYHPDSYDRELAARSQADQLAIEETLGGIRFVRNQIGHDLDCSDFIEPSGSATGRRQSTDWTWAPLPQPPGESLSPRGLTWELSRHHDYQSRLAGRPVGATFAVAASFLTVAAAGMAAAEDVRALDLSTR